MSKKSVLFITLSKAMNYTSPLLTFPILVRAFSIADYGIWIEVSTIIGLFYSLMFVGLINGANVLVMRKIVKDDEAYVQTLYIILALGLFVAGCVFLIAPLLNDLTIRQPVGITVLRISAFLIPVMPLPLLTAEIYRFRQRATMSASFEIIGAVSRPIIAVFALISHDIVVFSAVYVFAQILIGIVFVIITYRHSRFQWPSWTTIRQLISNGLNLSLVSQSSWVVMYGDRLLLSILSVSTAVAVYSASYQLTGILLALGSPYLYLLLPVLGEYWKVGNTQGSQQAIHQATRSMFILIVPSIIGISLTSNALLTVLANEQFATGNILTTMIAVGMAIETLGIALQYIFYAQGRPHILRNIYLQAAALNILANLVMIPLFSYNGAGLTTMLTFIYIFYRLWRKTEMPFTALFDMGVFWRCLLISVVMGLWVAFTVTPTIVGLGVAIIGGALIYGAGLLLLRVLTIDDVLSVPRAVMRRFAPQS